MVPPPSSVLERLSPSGKRLRVGTALRSGSLAPALAQPELNHVHQSGGGVGGLLLLVHLVSCLLSLDPLSFSPPLVPSLSLLCCPISSPSESLAGRAFRTSSVALREMVTSRVRWLSRAWGGRCRHRWGSSGQPCPHTSSHQQPRVSPCPKSLLCVITSSEGT